MRTLSLYRLSALLTLAAVILLPGLYSAVGAASRSGGIIYFNRAAGFNGAFTRPDVIIDGTKVGTIGSGECHGIRLSAGRHRIIIRDQVGLLSRLGVELNAARVNVWNGAEIFISVRALQEQDEFNEPSPAYDMLVSSRGRRC